MIAIVGGIPLTRLPGTVSKKRPPLSPGSQSGCSIPETPGKMSGAPITLPGRHVINAALAVAIVVIIVWFARSESYAAFWLLALAAFAFGVLIYEYACGAHPL